VPSPAARMIDRQVLEVMAGNRLAGIEVGRIYRRYAAPIASTRW